jgi:hypothetical protein
MKETILNKLIFDPKEGKTLFKPEGGGPGYWIGAPTIIFDKDEDKYFLYVRVRNPRPKEGKVQPNDTYRGYKCQIYESNDGLNFNLVWEMQKHEIGARSIEKAALIKIEGKYHIFLSYESKGLIPRWKVMKQSAAHPSEFNADKFREIDWNVPFFCRISIKDPTIKTFNGKYYLYVDYLRLKKPWVTTGVLVSENGEHFEWVGDIFANAKMCKWAQFTTRLTSIVSIGHEYLGFFDGLNELKNICDEKAGICMGITPKELSIWSLKEPTYHSVHGKGSVRYLSAIKEENTIRIYYEYTEAQGEHVLKHKSINLT